MDLEVVFLFAVVLLFALKLFGKRVYLFIFWRACQFRFEYCGKNDLTNVYRCVSVASGLY